MQRASEDTFSSGPTFHQNENDQDRNSNCINILVNSDSVSDYSSRSSEVSGSK